MFIFVCRGKEVLLGFLRGKGTVYRLEDPCHQIKEQWSFPAPKEFVVKWLEEKGGNIHLKHASYAEMLNRGKREVGELAYFGSEIEEVMSDWCSLRNIQLSQKKECLVWRWDVSSVLHFVGLKGDLQLSFL